MAIVHINQRIITSSNSPAGEQDFSVVYPDYKISTGRCNGIVACENGNHKYYHL